MGYSPPHTLYNTDQIVGEKTYSVGVILTPDETNPRYAIPAIFEKTLAIWRSFGIAGDICIGDEIIYETGTYSGGWDAFEMLLAKQAKFGTGVATLTATITKTPIVLMPLDSDERPAWRKSRKYHYVPNSWFDVSTKEGMEFFESEVSRRSFPNFISSDERYENLQKFSISDDTQKVVLYDSRRTLEENTQAMVEFMIENDWEADEQKARIALHEIFLSQLTGE